MWEPGPLALGAKEARGYSHREGEWGSPRAGRMGWRLQVQEGSRSPPQLFGSALGEPSWTWASEGW